MLKNIILVLVVAVLSLGGFFVYKNLSIAPFGVNSQKSATQAIVKPVQSTEPASPIFSYLPIWVPEAEWSAPQSRTQETPYGKLTGVEATGKITGDSDFEGRNFEDANVMSNLGFKTEDIKFAADGPGASQWGYTQTEGKQSWVVIFSYSTNRLLGPENTSPPFANISVFVSDAFQME